MRVAAIDIGTNTTRLLIADVHHGRTQWLVRKATVTTLGQGVDVTFLLNPDAVARTMATLREYAGMMAARQCDAVRAVATSAVRDASNRDVFLDGAAAVLGIRPEMVTGQEEAALAFRGTTAGTDAEPPYLVIDLGGGSTEFVLGTTEPDYAASVQIGSVRLTERAQLGVRPATPQKLAAARSRVDDVLDRQVQLQATPRTVLGVGGTYTSLAAIHRNLETYDPAVVHGTSMSLDELHELADRLSLLSVEDTAALPSLDPARAPVLLGGAVVAERSLRHAGADSILVSERDILDGIALSVAKR